MGYISLTFISFCRTMSQLNFISANETSAVAWLQTDRWALEHTAATQIVSHHEILLQLIKLPYIWSQSEIELFPDATYKVWLAFPSFILTCLGIGLRLNGMCFTFSHICLYPVFTTLSNKFHTSGQVYCHFPISRIALICPGWYEQNMLVSTISFCAPCVH